MIGCVHKNTARGLLAEPADRVLFEVLCMPITAKKYPPGLRDRGDGLPFDGAAFVAGLDQACADLTGFGVASSNIVDAVAVVVGDFEEGPIRSDNSEDRPAVRFHEAVLDVPDARDAFSVDQGYVDRVVSIEIASAEVIPVGGIGHGDHAPVVFARLQVDEPGTERVVRPVSRADEPVAPEHVAGSVAVEIAGRNGFRN